MSDNTDPSCCAPAGLRKEYGQGQALVRAVDGVDLDVAPGETVAVMGPSGCGKSTLLHLVGGLDRPSGGELLLAGRRIDQLGERALARMRRTAVGFVFQAFHLMDELTAVENVELPALLAGRSPRAARRRAADLLERVGLADRAALPAVGAVGRPASAGRDRQGAEQRAARRARRRTDRQSRQRRHRSMSCASSSACTRPARRWSSSPTMSGSRPPPTG